MKWILSIGGEPGMKYVFLDIPLIPATVLVSLGTYDSVIASFGKAPPLDHIPMLSLKLLVDCHPLSLILSRNMIYPPYGALYLGFLVKLH
jgi:hypothetical protein